jgi:hypothetical protein
VSRRRKARFARDDPHEVRTSGRHHPAEPPRLPARPISPSPRRGRPGSTLSPIHPRDRVAGHTAEHPVPAGLLRLERGAVALGAVRPAVTDRVIALVNTGRPPSVGSFSRSAITTRLWGAVESAECQSHATVQPSGTTTCTAPSRWPLMSADGAPDTWVTSSKSRTDRAALSGTTQGAGAAAGAVWASATAGNVTSRSSNDKRLDMDGLASPRGHR